MRKITKKEGIALLMNNASKQVLNSWSTLKEALGIVNTVSRDNYASILKSNPARIGIKNSSKQIVFKVEGKANSYLEGLSNTDWYIEEVHGTKMIIIDFNCKGEQTVLGYTLV